MKDIHSKDFAKVISGYTMLGFLPSTERTQENYFKINKLDESNSFTIRRGLEASAQSTASNSVFVHKIMKGEDNSNHMLSIALDMDTPNKLTTLNERKRGFITIATKQKDIQVPLSLLGTYLLEDKANTKDIDNVFNFVYNQVEQQPNEEALAEGLVAWEEISETHPHSKNTIDMARSNMMEAQSSMEK